MNTSIDTLTPQQLKAALDYLINRISETQTGPFDASVPFDFDADDPDLRLKAIRSLDHNGVVVVRNYMPSALAGQIGDRINAFIDRIEPLLESFEPAEYERFFVQHIGKPIFSNYHELAMAAKPVVNIRMSPDEGMIDIFNVDRLFGDWRDALAVIRNPFVLDVIGAATGRTYAAHNTNVYFNRGVAHTRGFHADSPTLQVKAFIYLSDVLSNDDGAHLYGRGTHKEDVALQLNMEINQLLGVQNDTNFAFFDPSRAVSLLGERGTLIISYQKGAHRGAPQASGAKRMVLTQNFRES